MAEHFVTSLSYVVSRGNFGEFFANYDTSIKFEDCLANIDVTESLGQVRDSTAFSNFVQLLLTLNTELAMDEAAAAGRIQQQ